MFTGTIKSIQNKSGAAKKVFSKTIDELEAINTEINNEVNIRQSQIVLLTEELNTLVSTRISNDSTINKISKLIEVDN